MLPYLLSQSLLLSSLSLLFYTHTPHRHVLRLKREYLSHIYHPVTHIGIQFDGCKRWIHQLCAKIPDLKFNMLSESRKSWRCTSCKSSEACHLKKAPVSTYVELFALRDGFIALSFNVVSKTGTHKSLIDLLRLDKYAVILAVTTSSTTQDSES